LPGPVGHGLVVAFHFNLGALAAGSFADSHVLTGTFEVNPLGPIQAFHDIMSSRQVQPVDAAFEGKEIVFAVDPKLAKVPANA